MRGIHILQHGRTIGKYSWTYEDRRNIHSCTKTVTSCGVAIALKHGYFKLDDKIAQFFESDLPKNPSPWLLDITVENLLTMSAGFEEPIEDTFRIANIENYPKLILGREVVYKPGAHFRYDTGCAYLLGALIQKVTGSLHNFIEYNVLRPIGIINAPWPESIEGVCLGGSALMFTTEEMAIFGQLLLQKGEWNGRQLVPRDYLEEAVTTMYMSEPENGKPPRGYGYMIWNKIWPEEYPDCYYASGSWAKYILIFPMQEAVIAIGAHEPTWAKRLSIEEALHDEILKQL
ncbi:MAG TPA: serine hydrolase [Bacillota bacterium]|nr:serine hydrolase [Bacillota bacterium]